MFGIRTAAAVGASWSTFLLHHTDADVDKLSKQLDLEQPDVVGQPLVEDGIRRA